MDNPWQPITGIAYPRQSQSGPSSGNPIPAKNTQHNSNLLFSFSSSCPILPTNQLSAPGDAHDTGINIWRKETSELSGLHRASHILTTNRAPFDAVPRLTSAQLPPDDDLQAVWNEPQSALSNTSTAAVPHLYRILALCRRRIALDGAPDRPQPASISLTASLTGTHGR